MNCAGFTKDGRQCGARAQRGKIHCLFHDPERREDFIAASAKGGKGKLPLAPPPQVVEVMKAMPSIRDPLSISEFLGDLTQRVLSGELHPSIANSAAYLAAQRINALKVASAIQKEGAERSPVHLQRGDDDENYQLKFYHEDMGDAEDEETA